MSAPTHRAVNRRIRASRIKLSEVELSAIIAAAGNADPAMWEDEPDSERGDRLERACETGLDKLRTLLSRARGEP